MNPIINCSNHRYRSRQTANQPTPPSAVTPFPLSGYMYDITSADVKRDQDSTKEPPPKYTAPSSPVVADTVPSYWEPTTAL